MSTAIVSIPAHIAAPQQAAVKHVKVSLRDDTRRFAVADDRASFAQLCDSVRQVYGLPAGAALLCKYTDEEGDAVSLSSDAELAEAFRVAGDAALRLAVCPTDAPAPASADAPAPVVATAVRAPRSAKAAAKPAPAVAKEQEAPAAPAPDAKGKARADPSAKKVAALKERNGALHGRLEAFKGRMAEMKAARAAGHMHAQALRRDLAFERASAHPKCKAVLARGRFVRDVSVPDGSVMSAGAAFTKAWRFRNDSAAAWAPGARLLFAGKGAAERMGAPEEVRVERAVAPGDEIDIAVPLAAPRAPGRHVAHFRLCDADGRWFGQRVWCSILVRDAASSSPSSEGEAEAAAVAADAGAVKYERQLQALAEMHHTDARLNARLLNKFDGDLEAVVARLLARQAKLAARAGADSREAAEEAGDRAARKLAKAEARAARTAARLTAKAEKKAGNAA